MRMLINVSASGMGTEHHRAEIVVSRRVSGNVLSRAQLSTLGGYVSIRFDGYVDFPGDPILIEVSHPQVQWQAAWTYPDDKMK